MSMWTTTDDAAPLRGVNLGGWLVLEKWLTPELFEGTEAVDEYQLCLQAGTKSRKLLTRHRETYITKDDFIWLKEHGIQAVRLPVGYWIFGGEKPYTGGIEYVDRAFNWARSNGIKILLDLHAAPGSQNGYDHSGRGGVVAWHKDEQNIVRTLAVLKQLARRYARDPAFLGIEMLNEPKWTIPRRKLIKFYQGAYRMLREECDVDAWVVFHDSFRPGRWKRKLRGSEYINFYMDRHHYQTHSERDRRINVQGHLHKLLYEVPEEINKIQQSHQLIIGEWSLSLNERSLEGLNMISRDAASRAFAAAQLLAFRSTKAWFFWNYKAAGGGGWSYRDSVQRGWLPDKY